MNKHVIMMQNVVSTYSLVDTQIKTFVKFTDFKN